MYIIEEGQVRICMHQGVSNKVTQESVKKQSRF